METYKTKLDERVAVLHQPALTEVIKPVTRQELINRDWVVEQPLIKRAHNRFRKDTLLTTEQLENLKGIYGIDAKRMNEKDVLSTLRKRYKNYKFTETILILT